MPVSLKPAANENNKEKSKQTMPLQAHMIWYYWGRCDVSLGSASSCDGTRKSRDVPKWSCVDVEAGVVAAFSFGRFVPVYQAFHHD